MKPYTPDPLTYLFVGAHPDDIEINAGGTIHHLTSLGYKVAAFVASHNPASVRGQETINALSHLGVPYHLQFFADLPEPNLHTHLQPLITSLEDAIKVFQPSTVVTHFHGDTHQDHETVNKATMVAARFVPSIYMYVPTYHSGRTNIPAIPNLVSFFNKESMSAKLAALSKFKTQKVKYGNDEWLSSIEGIAKGDAWRYGGKHGYAELFQISRTTRF